MFLKILFFSLFYVKNILNNLIKKNNIINHEFSDQC